MSTKKASTKAGKASGKEAEKPDAELNKAVYRCYKWFCDKHNDIFNFGYLAASKPADVTAIKAMLEAYGEERLTKAIEYYIRNYEQRFATATYRTPRVLGLKYAAPNIIQSLLTSDAEPVPSKKKDEKKNPFEDSEDWL
jgi:hypothetical protein